ncbi:MAG: hypothetical protein ACRC9X_00645 [Bacteroidales bacterium]
MKKLLFVSLVALMGACCCPKGGVEVDKLIASPAEFAGQEVEFTGTAAKTPCGDSTKIAVYGTDSSKFIAVQLGEGVSCCKKACGKAITVKGTVTEVAACDGSATKMYIVVASSIEKAKCCKDKGTCTKDSASCCKKDKKTCDKDSASCCTKDKKACDKDAESCDKSKKANSKK